MNFKMFITAAVVTIMIGQVSYLHAAPKITVVSKRAKAAIAANFPGAENLRWATDQSNVYTAYFAESDVRRVANVDKFGNIISVVTYYKAGSEPSNVRALLADKYPGKTLGGVTGIELNDGDAAGVYYQANLEDAKHWYFVMINGNDVVTKQVLDK